jgi:hypothetical protein
VTSLRPHGNELSIGPRRAGQPGFRLIRKRKIGLAPGGLVLALIFCAFVAVFRNPSGPAYGGKSLSVWLDELANSPLSSVPPDLNRNASAREIHQALHAIGTNCIPTLLRMVRTRDSAIRRNLVLLARRQSLVPVRWHTGVELHFQALLGFQVLGRSASPAADELTELALHDPDPAVRHTAADALFWVEPNGDIPGAPGF